MKERATHWGKAAYLIATWAAVLLWGLLIYSFSAQTADRSKGLSLEVTDVVARALDPQNDIDRADARYERLHLAVRKTAHALEYAMLAFLLGLALAPCGMKPARKAMLTLFLCLAFACADEWHQSFVEGRGPGVMDVGIDALGAIVGCAAVFLCRFVAIRFADRGLFWRRWRKS